jgi:hypothetical protein
MNRTSTFGRAGGNSGIFKDLKMVEVLSRPARAPAHKIQFQQEYGRLWSGDLSKKKAF